MSELKKVLDTYGLTMIAVGACIGSGIFVTPAESMRLLGHHGYVLVAWFIGGLITFLGAMTFSELGSMFPKEGGVYVYLKNAYGNVAGFLYGWIILLIVNTGALAALGLALADYLKFFYPFTNNQKSMIAIVIIWLLSIVNIFGVQVSQRFASVFTGLKLTAIFLIIAIGFYHYPNIQHDIQLDLTKEIPEALTSQILLAFIGVFWSMGGWHHATYLSGEAKNAQSTVPRAMLFGTLMVTITYLLLIFAYMILLPPSDMSSSQSVAGDALSSVITYGGRWVSVIISISIFGTIGIYTMTAPRIYYAMAKDGIFFPVLAKLSVKYKTPYVAMIFQAIWATVLIFVWGSFNKIITFVTFMDIVFMALATSTIFVFRRKNQANLGFRLTWFPWIPLLYLLVTLAFVINTLISLDSASLAGVAILLAGIPVYFYFKKQNGL